MDWNFESPVADTTAKAEQSSKPAKRMASDSAKVSLRALLAAEKAEAHQQKIAARKASLDSLPLTFFITPNAAYTSMPQWSYGFKIGTVKFLGWYFSAMTNFQYKGAFSPLLAEPALYPVERLQDHLHRRRGRTGDPPHQVALLPYRGRFRLPLPQLRERPRLA